MPGSPRKKTIAAGPKKASGGPRVKKVKAEPSELDRLQAVIVGSLEDDKAENVVTMDLAGKAMFCDRMVIASGLADRQISAMAQHLSEKLKDAGLKRVQVEGAGGSDWVLIDAGRHRGASVQAGGADDVCAGEDVGRGPGRGGLGGVIRVGLAAVWAGCCLASGSLQSAAMGF